MGGGAKHTLGPWQFYADLPSVEPNWHIVTNASRMRVVANVHIEPGNAVDLANARLIAAAPDMLGFVSMIANFTPAGRDAEDDALVLNRLIEEARILRAKAEGEAPSVSTDVSETTFVECGP